MIVHAVNLYLEKQQDSIAFFGSARLALNTTHFTSLVYSALVTFDLWHGPPIFLHHLIAKGHGEFVLKFWTKIRRGCSLCR